ncbi:MAG: 3-phosphoshikimate 1-carboxyvinyltransferase [Cytophagales bacterium]
MEIVSVSAPKSAVKTAIKLVSSKSESNRALIINAVSGHKATLGNLSEARDTQTMMRLLKSDDEILDVLDAGTTMRFLTAFTALSGKSKTMTGTARMCERPISLLVDALRDLGAKIDYLKNDGYPPIKTQGFSYSGNNHLKIKGDVSSQYISALLMTAPLLPNGLKLELTGKIGSKPYIDMTIDLMAHFGVKAKWTENQVIEIEAGQQYSANEYEIESDWSGASYWFSIVALSPDSSTQIELLGLKENSLQGDSAVVKLMESFGVKSEFTGNGFLLSKCSNKNEVFIDFTQCPDLAQTFAACAAAKGIKLQMTGLESLRIKETDRIAALQNELKKLGASMEETEKDVFTVVPVNSPWSAETIIETYDDHRMAMAFAPLSMVYELKIKEPKVVAKSYPSYWEHLTLAGFSIKH